MLNLLSPMSEGVFDEADIALRVISDEAHDRVGETSRKGEDPRLSVLQRVRT